MLRISVLRIRLAIVRRRLARRRRGRGRRELVLLVGGHLPSMIQHLAGRGVSTGRGLELLLLLLLLLGLRFGVFGFLAIGSERVEMLVLSRVVCTRSKEGLIDVIVIPSKQSDGKGKGKMKRKKHEPAIFPERETLLRARATPGSD
jgi:hypothetical protein